jgi:3-hydroxyisobutyrate dehydrogenase-like beta-hydroxyacid dehydrogenase
MTSPVVGVVSAGEMGSALGAALRRGGARVLTSTAGRSSRTAELARQAQLELVDLDALVARSSVLLCVVPPQHATSVVEDLVARARRDGVRPLLAELDAVSPGTVAALAALAAGAGLPFVDGALSGAPPGTGGAPTRLVLAGPDAARVAGLPWTDVDVSVVSARIGAASAVKMCTGGVRKGVTALVIDALLAAAEHDVLEPVVAELQRALRRDPLVEVELAAAKAERFVPEMLAVADTLAGAGLDPALHRAVAAVFERTACSPLARRRPEEVDRDGGRSPAGRAAVVAALRPESGRGERA